MVAAVAARVVAELVAAAEGGVEEAGVVALQVAGRGGATVDRQGEGG